MFTTPESSVLNWDAGPNETELTWLAYMKSTLMTEFFFEIM